jgi:hypothetical protein
MRHSRLIALIPMAALLLSGCGPDTGSGSSAFNPATPVTRTFDDFTVKNEGGNPYINRTMFYDFYKGLEPAEGADDKGTAAGIRERLNRLMGLTPGPEGKTYVAARNPLDFLHHLINTDRIGTFNDGKRLMYDSVTSGDPATYNTPAKNAIIRFIERHETAEPAPDQEWVYPLLDWTSSFSQFEPITASVFRSAQFIARAPAEGESDPAETKSAFWSGEFDGETFSTTGYNPPEYSAFSVTGRQYGNVEFYQAFQGKQYDTLILTGTSGIMIDGTEPAYICVLASYDTREVKVVYVVDPEDGTVGDGSRPDVQCPDVGNTFTYQAMPVTERQ